METITIVVHRSDNWLAARRLATGRNVPESVEVQIDPADLTQESRAILLQCGGGQYRKLERLSFGRDYRLVSSGMCSYGYRHVVIDEDPDLMTPPEISARIDAALREAARQIGEREEKRRQDAEKQRQDALDLENARALLAGEFRTLENRLDQVTGRWQTLDRFVGALPAGVIISAIEAAADKQSARALSEARDEIRAALDDAVTWDVPDFDDIEE